jgi:hypothetical protein
MRMVVCDPHSELTMFDNVAHLSAPVARTPDEINRIMRFVESEYIHRRQNNIRDAHKLVAMVDEGNMVMDDPDNLRIAETLGFESRKFGVHLIVAASDASKSGLGRLTKMTSNKFFGYINSARDSANVAGAGMQLHRLTGKGDFMHITPNRIERFQAGLVSEIDFDRLPRQAAPELPEIEESPAFTLPVEERPDLPGPGRPTIELEPEIMVAYLASLVSGDSISIRTAKEWFDLSKHMHIRYKDFASRMVVEIDNRRMKILGSGE